MVAVSVKMKVVLRAAKTADRKVLHWAALWDVWKAESLDVRTAEMKALKRAAKMVACLVDPKAVLWVDLRADWTAYNWAELMAAWKVVHLVV